MNMDLILLDSATKMKCWSFYSILIWGLPPLPLLFLNTYRISIRSYPRENILALLFKFSVIIVFVIIAQSFFELTNEIDLEQV